MVWTQTSVAMMQLNAPLLVPSDFLLPDWPAPAQVRAIATSRALNTAFGASTGVFAGLNLGDHVGDEPDAVSANRQALQQALGLTQAPLWLSQVHGTRVLNADTELHSDNIADASVTCQHGLASVVMTADCLPVLFCNQQGTQVAAAHAGWRGLCDGVLEATVACFDQPHDVLCWLGPAIGPSAFEVGSEVRAAFIAKDPQAAAAFVPSTHDGKWLADIFLLARQRLRAVGVNKIYGGGVCTVSDPTRFYSYRRDGQTGRLASLVWLTN